MRRTVHPPAASVAVSCSSLYRFRSNFSCQKVALVFGSFPCLAQPCQKHPSTNIARRCVGKTTSTLDLTPGTGRRCVKKRRPSRWSADRSRTSGPVSNLRLPCIVRRTAGVLAQEPSLLTLGIRLSQFSRRHDRRGADKQRPRGHRDASRLGDTVFIVGEQPRPAGNEPVDRGYGGRSVKPERLGSGRQ